ncbi:arylesterase [Methylomarinum sp. Ch1-1]|uniref:Arylesterase n=1 Tax=Methylomarinum roseum TaxID=3067653 RepID=A0AAU7NWX3_9GAMM
MKPILFACFLMLLFGCEQPPQLNKLPTEAVILAFGDSLTYGTGASPQRNYPSVLSQLTGLQVINAGIPGEISRNGRKRLPDILDKQQPDLLILIHGGNDILRKIPPQQTQENIRQMIEEANRRNIDVVLFGVPRPGLIMMSSAALYQQIAENQAVVHDLNTLPEILGDPALKSDMIHPNDRGYRIIAENVYRLLQQQGAL